MNYDRLRDHGAIYLIRTSTTAQADTSIPQQQATFDRFIDEWSIRKHDSVELPGVSGSIPGNRKDIQQIIDRKRRGEPFDLLLVLDTTRFTRSGGHHINKLEEMLEDAGIEVVYVNDPIPEGDAGDFYKFCLGWAAQQTAKRISEGVTRGTMAALQDERMLPFGRPPFGIDRLYRTPDGRPSHIIRAVADGTQVQLHAETGEVVARFGRNEKTGTPAHYKKQKAETVEPVPGDPERVAAVVMIYELHYVQGRGTRYIARVLNDLGIASATGGKWSMTTIGNLLVNPVYLGWGIANRMTRGIYNMRSAEGPLLALVEVGDEETEHLWQSIKEATVKRFHYDDHQQLRHHLATFLMAYNFAKRLKTLRGLTPHEFACSRWQHEPERFVRDPTHHDTAGLYSCGARSSRGCVA